MKFFALSVMARQYLGVPATSASADRLFSIAGCIFASENQAGYAGDGDVGAWHQGEETGQSRGSGPWGDAVNGHRGMMSGVIENQAACQCAIHSGYYPVNRHISIHIADNRVTNTSFLKVQQ